MLRLGETVLVSGSSDSRMSMSDSGSSFGESGCVRMSEAIVEKKGRGNHHGDRPPTAIALTTRGAVLQGHTTTFLPAGGTEATGQGPPQRLREYRWVAVTGVP